MRILTLGACCKKSIQFFENTKIAVEKMGLEIKVENTGDIVEIAKYGVMQQPALIVNNKVLTYGKLLTPEQIINLIEKEI
ncbi:thioredoxin family protein [Clostridium baratii]|uniref:thioredoxin family protein n=1 Tax=Clostridium baratii TaxID=1561 RepID=UPI001C2132AF|nr:thioredoxin family protein [Clostridium baratii]